MEEIQKQQSISLLTQICDLKYAQLQGLDKLIEHFQYSKVLNHK